MRRLVPLLAFSLVAASDLSARADPVTDQIDQGKQYYGEGDFAGAVQELEFAIRDIKGKLTEQYKAALPPAPAGWTAADAAQESAPEALFGGGTSISRAYTQEGGEGRMTATLMVDSPMVQGIMALLANPALLGAQPDAKRVRVGRENAMLTWKPEEKSGEVNLGLGGKVLVKVEGQNLDSGDRLVDLLKAFKLDDVRKLAGL